MARITTALFDFDGVITDTEPQYDVYFDNLSVQYNLGIDHFASKVKGVTLPNILDKYFSNYSQEEKQKIVQETKEFELQMHYEFIPGVREYIQHLQENGFKTGLVTSSLDYKMEVALQKLDLNDVFDTKVTANRITQGKPNPMCYQLAARDLNAAPSECLVFEDALFGIQAGNAADMRVIGVATTLPAEKIEPLVHAVIYDFTDLPRLISFMD